MGLITWLFSRSFSWYFGIGNQAVRIVCADESRVTVRIRILSPARGYKLVELSGAATPIDTVSVCAPEGWSRSDEEVERSRVRARLAQVSRKVRATPFMQ